MLQFSNAAFTYFRLQVSCTKTRGTVTLTHTCVRTQMRLVMSTALNLRTPTNLHGASMLHKHTHTLALLLVDLSEHAGCEATMSCG